MRTFPSLTASGVASERAKSNLFMCLNKYSVHSMPSIIYEFRRFAFITSHSSRETQLEKRANEQPTER